MTTTDQTAALSYRGDPDLKAALVAEMADHARLDQLVQGDYLRQDGKGCAVGCTISGRLLAELGTVEALEEHVRESGGWHETWAQATGLPAWLGGLDDMVFEGLTVEQSKAWPVRLLDAVPVGVDLSPVRDLIIRDVVMDPGRGAVACAAIAAESAGFPEQAAELRAVPFDAPYDVVQRVVTKAREGSGAATAAASAAAAAKRADAAHAAFASASAAYDAAFAALCRHDRAGGARHAHWAWIAERAIHHLANSTALDGTR